MTIGDGQMGDGQRGQVGDGQLGDGTRRDGGDRVSIGDVERPEIARPAGGATRPAAGDRESVGTSASRDAARSKIESRQSAGGGVATLPASRPSVNRPSGGSRSERGNAAFRVEQIAVGGPEFQHLAPDDDTAADRPGAEQVEHLPEIVERKPRLRLEQPRTLEREQQRRRRRRKKEIT